MRRFRICALVLIALFGLSCNDAAEPPAKTEVPPDDLFATEVSLYSQLNEELIVRDFFHDKRGGVFLDVGCATPISNNTTYYLEKHLGWSGIAIDALPEYGPAWEKTRPNAKFFSYAVAETSGETVTFYRARAPALSSLSEKNIQKWGGQSEPIQVTTITLTKLLDDNGITKVDFMSLDIEGAEGPALQGFDIGRFKPDLVGIEFGVSEEQDRFVLAYMIENGYERIDRYKIYDHVNSYFRRSSESQTP